MAGKTVYMEKKVLDAAVGKTAFGTITARVGLLTAAPSDSTAGTEVSGGSYARVTTAAADWNAASGTTGDPSTTTNANAITFPTASASWGTVTHFGIYDAATAGNLLYWGALTTSKTIGSGDTASFAAGQLTITES